jgi:energy-coupling factor transport system permease protein
MKEVNPILKIFSLIAYLVLVIISINPVALAISGFLILVIMMISGRDLFEYIRSAEAFLIILALACVVIAIVATPVTAILVLAKGMMVIFSLEVVSKTTEQVDMLDGFTHAFSLNATGSKWAFLIADFLPNQRRELDRIKASRIARGERSTGRGRPILLVEDIRVLMPALKNTRIRTMRTAKALDDKCYDITTRRVRIKPLRFSKKDVIALVVMVIYFVSILVLNIYGSSKV